MDRLVFLDQLQRAGFSEEDTRQGGIEQFVSSKAFQQVVGAGREFDMAHTLIKDDEKVLGIMGTQLKYLAKDHNALAIITDERLITIDKKLINTDIQEFYLDQLSSANLKTHGLLIKSAEVIIRVVGDTMELGKVRVETAQKFSAAMKNAMSEYKGREKKGSTPVQVASSADELKKFKELLDEGIITQQDFDQKKKQLLGL